MSSSTILVTGGTGTLGRPTVAALRDAGHDVRVLSRAAGNGRLVGDLATGAGLAAALAGVDTVVHLATNARKDSGQTATLLTAAAAAQVRHLVYISIVGIDDIPFAYYVDKLACERLIERSGIPFTILRATQFHDFVAKFLRPLRRLPFLIALDVSDQPIAVEEVAARLAELVDAPPAGRVDDIGGPEQKTVRELVDIWQTAHQTTKPVWMLRLPGKTIRAYQRGHHMTSMPGFGRETFQQFAERDATAGP
ncbi:NAD(P)H-binding protein [soil metagenome]